LNIDLRLDWSWLVIFALLTWNLVAVFARWHLQWPPGVAFGTSVLASLIFFGCVLLHELAHSLVGRALGLRVRNITLFLFGGVSNIEMEPGSPGTELVTATVGPLTSIALGLCFALLASVVISPPMLGSRLDWTTLSLLGPFATLLAWLSAINVLIGIFNLIPAFPLDGGRILRAILWSATGDLGRATRWAAGVGLIIAWLFIGVGIAMSFGVYVPLFGTGLVSGLWIAFIGWFLQGASAQTSMRVALDEVLSGKTVEQFMRRDVPIVSPELFVSTLVHEHIIPGDDRAILVVRGERLVGLVTLADLGRVPPDCWAVATVGAIMRPRDALYVTDPDEDLGKAFEQLAGRDVGQLPVEKDGRLVGILRRRDVTRWLELGWRPKREHGGVPRGRASEQRGKRLVGGRPALRRHALDEAYQKPSLVGPKERQEPRE
jgi:Zn-dependent protease/CBS domain-containing protein